MNENLSGDIPFSSWAIIWAETYKLGNIRTKSYEDTYKFLIEVHLIPYFHETPIKEIKQIHIQQLFNSKRNYSTSFLNKIRLILNGMFNAAIANELLSYNPCLGLKTPKSKKKPRKKRAYSRENAEILTLFAFECKYTLDLLLPLKAGLRRSELLSLTWEDIDIKEGLIHVRRSVTDTSSGMEINECKSEKSERDLPIGGALMRALSSAQGEGLVIRNAKGEMYSPHGWWQRRYKPLMCDFERWCAARNIKMPILKTHELRHTFGSLLYASGVDIVTISRLMGHSSTDFTARIYVHNDPLLMKKAIELLE